MLETIKAITAIQWIGYGITFSFLFLVLLSAINAILSMKWNNKTLSISHVNNYRRTGMHVVENHKKITDDVTIPLSILISAGLTKPLLTVITSLFISLAS